MFRTLLAAGALMLLTACAHTPPAPDGQAGQLKAASDAAFATATDPADAPMITTLKNGMRVLIKPDDRFPLVNVRVYVHAGAAYEDPEQAGISHLLEHMVFKGTDHMAAGETALAIESVGGSLNAGTSWDYTVYYVEVPDAEWKLGMDTVRDMVFHAKVDPAELKPEKEVVLSELKRGEDQPGSMVFKTTSSMLFKGTSYEWPVIGFRDTVKGITAEDIHAYVGKLYQPQSMLLVVAGKVDPDEVLQWAEKTYGGYENTRAVEAASPYAIEPGTGPEVRVLEGQWNKVYMAAAFRVPDLHSSKVTGLEVLAQLLGGDETSLLYRTFKYERGLVDDISAFSYSLDRVGMFYISATLDADKAQQFWTELSRFMAGFDPADFTQQELARAKLNLADSLFLAKETLSGLASKLGAMEFLYGGQHVEPNYLAELDRIGTDDLQALADEFLRPEALKSCLLMPEGAGLDQTALTAELAKNWPVQNGEAAAKKAHAGTTEQVVDLPGGSKLVFLPDATLPYTALSVFWPGGDSLLAPDSQGLAALTAASLTRGTEDMTATQIEDFLSDRAASMAAASGRDTFSVSAKYPAWFSVDMLELLDGVLTGPSWPLKEIDLAKSDQIAAIHVREDKPLGLLFRRTFPFLFQDTHYRYLHQGEPEDVGGFSPEAIREYWRTQSAEPFVLAVCGTFDEAEMRAFATALATRLTCECSGLSFAKPAWGTERDKTITLPDRNQAHLLAVFPVPGSLDEETGAGLQLLRAALAGQSGLLFRDLRDKQGLGYTVTAFVWQAPETGFMAFYIGTDPDKLDQAEEGFRQKVAMLAESPLPEEEIARARNILTGEYYQENQPLLARSREAASLMALGRERTADRDRIERAQELTADDLLKLAKAYLKWDEAYLVKVAP